MCETQEYMAYILATFDLRVVRLKHAIPFQGCIGRVLISLPLAMSL